MIDTAQASVKTPIAIPSALAAELSGITYRQLVYWDRIGVVGPSVAEACGSGSRRRYSLEDVTILRLLAEVTSLGVPISRLDRTVQQLRQIEDWSGPLYLTRHGQLGGSLEILRGDVVGVVIDLGALRSRIELAIEERGR